MRKHEWVRDREIVTGVSLWSVPWSRHPVAVLENAEGDALAQACAEDWDFAHYTDSEIWEAASAFLGYVIQQDCFGPDRFGDVEVTYSRVGDDADYGLVPVSVDFGRDPYIGHVGTGVHESL